ncbi:MAG: PD-(D/E)XK nuclease family protein [Candidatus Omnitrophica bacterium]|nr:PD-(D/E)XK nuclease family protein [Candidatus Omnitrophota bacterium]
MSKIYSVGFDVDLIELLTGFLLKEHKANPQDLSSSAVVFPGKRPQFYLRNALSGRIKKPFLPPCIFSIEEFIQYLAKKSIELAASGKDSSGELNISSISCQPASLIDACFLVHKAIQKLNLTYLNWQKQLEFEHFFLWAKRIFNFLEELDKEQVTERQLLDLEENAQIGLPLPEYVNRLLENISQIQAGFHGLLNEYKLTTSGLNYLTAAQSIDKICLSEFKQIYFMGLFALNACEKKIIKHLLEEGQAVLFWQKDEDNWSIFEELGIFFNASTEIIRPGSKYPKIKIYEGFDIHSQAEGARRVLSELEDLDNTCIVLPQADALMPLLHQALPDNLKSYNISLGYSLKGTPIYALIKMIIQLEERKRHDGSFYIKDYLNVLMHPYIKNISKDGCSADDTRILIHKIEEALLGIDKSISLGRKPFIKLEDIENNQLIFQAAAKLINDAGFPQVQVSSLEEQLKIIHRIFVSLFEGCLKLVDFVRATQKMIYFIFEKSRISSDIFAGEACAAFLSLLDKLGASLFKNEELKLKNTFFELLKTYLVFENIPFQGTPLRGLQILGLLETRNLKFKNLIVLDLNEGLLPKANKGESFIPEGVFPILGLPHYHKREEIMRYHFRRLLGSSDNAFLFYQASSLNKESRSRFIEEIIWQEEKKSNKLYDSDKIQRIEFSLAPAREGFALKKTDKALEIIKENIFSPTSLDRYLYCPAQFYFRYCLGLKEKESIPEEIEASEIGNFLHALLRDFYALFLNKDLNLDDSARDYLFELKDKKMKEFFPQASGEQFLLSKIIDYKLKSFLLSETKRKEKIKILYLEQELPLDLQKITINTDFGQACLRGKLDRVDERIIKGKKRIVILDYKTGRYKLPRKIISAEMLATREGIKKAIGSFQLPLYVYLFSKSSKIPPSLIEASFYSLRDIKEEFLFGSFDSAKIFEVYLTAARTLLSEIMDPAFEFVRDDSDEYYCRWCPFPSLCKR